MASLRPFHALDLFKFNLTNLDPLTETYDISFYLSYLAKWPSLFNAVEGTRGELVGYSQCPIFVVFLTSNISGYSLLRIIADAMGRLVRQSWASLNRLQCDPRCNSRLRPTFHGMLTLRPSPLLPRLDGSGSLTFSHPPLNRLPTTIMLSSWICSSESAIALPSACTRAGDIVYGDASLDIIPTPKARTAKMLMVSFALLGPQRSPLEVVSSVEDG